MRTLREDSEDLFDDGELKKLDQPGPKCCKLYTPKARYDCKKCGACCGSFFVGQQGILRVPVLPKDVERLPRAFRRHLVKYFDGRLMIKATKRGGKFRCPALRGRIGRDPHCTIYNRRPFNCRYYEVDTYECNMARFEQGLPARWPREAGELVLGG